MKHLTRRASDRYSTKGKEDVKHVELINFKKKHYKNHYMINTMVIRDLTHYERNLSALLDSFLNTNLNNISVKISADDFRL